MVQSVISLFVEQNVGGNNRDLEESLRFINAQIADYESQLSAADRRIGDFRRDHGEALGGRAGRRTRVVRG